MYAWKHITASYGACCSTAVALNTTLGLSQPQCMCCAAVVRELDALMLVVEQWPRRREACLAQAAAAAAAQPGTAASTGSRRGSVTGPRPDGGGDRLHAAATLEWLADHNNMEARIVDQLVSLRPRVTASTGSGIFSGGQQHLCCCGSTICGVDHTWCKDYADSCCDTSSVPLHWPVTSYQPLAVPAIQQSWPGVVWEPDHYAVHTLSSCPCRDLHHPWAAAVTAA